MYIYKVELMPGYKAKSVDDTSGKYHIRRLSINTSVKDKKHRDIIRTNLDYDEAVAQAKIFNDKEGASGVVEGSREELKIDNQNEGPADETPLFLRNNSESPQGNAQDEKDGTSE